MLLYAYGSYGASMDPYFSSVRLSLLDRGFAFAIAHIRGGEKWEDIGMRKVNFLIRKIPSQTTLPAPNTLLIKIHKYRCPVCTRRKCRWFANGSSCQYGTPIVQRYDSPGALC